MKSLISAQANRLLERQARSCTTWSAMPHIGHPARLSDTRVDSQSDLASRRAADTAGGAKLLPADVNQSHMLSTAQPLVFCYPRLGNEMQSRESSCVGSDRGSAVSRWAHSLKGEEKERTPVCATEGTAVDEDTSLPGALVPRSVKAGSGDASGCLQKNAGAAANVPVTPGYRRDHPVERELPGSNTQTGISDDKNTCRSGENSGSDAGQHSANSNTQEEAENKNKLPGTAANKSVEPTASRTVQPSACTGQEGNRATQWSVIQPTTLGAKFGRQQQAGGEEQEMTGVCMATTECVPSMRIPAFATLRRRPWAWKATRCRKRLC
ncbi:hypothetical protein DIPPA_18623 [Diplonema papillatum]|nr:hypothetical protein DIPPA_18623 [Diplonema papillatum]